MNKYIVKLIPIGRFFFGGDMTFEVSGQTGHNEKFSSYIIHSLKFPQQTSLLGMLRFLILSNDEQAFDSNTQKITDTAKAESLIGKRSFTINDDHKDNVYGKIVSIGSCFLYKGGEYYYQAPFDYEWKMGPNEQVHAYLNGKLVCIPTIRVGKDMYTSKDSMNKCYLSKNGTTLKEEDVFQEDSRIGIRKGINGKTEEEAFYKQIGYRLKEDCCFAFEVEVNDIDLIDPKYNGQLVTVGADSSMFVLQIEKGGLNVDLPSSYQKENKDLEKVVLLADTYLPETNLVEYAVSEIKPFRFIKTTVDSKSYHIMYGLKNRSERYNLFAAGSVFFVKDATTFKKSIEAIKEFVQIGYNHCK